MHSEAASEGGRIRAMRENSENSGLAALWTAFALLVLVVVWLMADGRDRGLLLLGTMGLAFGAFCVWLAVRIFNRRERWAKRTAGLTIALAVVYLLSFPVLATVFFVWNFPSIVMAPYLPLVLLWEEWPVLKTVFELFFSPIGLATAILGLLATGIFGVLTARRWFKENAWSIVLPCARLSMTGQVIHSTVFNEAGRHAVPRSITIQFDEAGGVDRVELLQSSVNVLRLPRVPRQKGRGTLGFGSATPSA
jgi:hypothetical protein